MTTYRCPCPYGCHRHAAGLDICENCRLGFHGRYCSKFVPRPPDTDVWTSGDCAECGGWRIDHPEDPHFRYGDHSGPHAPAGLLGTARIREVSRPYVVEAALRALAIARLRLRG